MRTSAMDFFTLPVLVTLDSPRETIHMGETMQSTSSLELSLITVAVISSLGLVYTTKIKVLNFSRHPVFTCTAVLMALVFTYTAIALSIATLVLGWRRSISIDAVGAILFALLPGIMSVPSHVFHYFHTSRMMREKASLCVATQNFRYVRYHGECRSDANAGRWTKPLTFCEKGNCKVSMYIRSLPNPKNGYQATVSLTVFISWLQQMFPFFRNRSHSENADIQWYGVRTGHTNNFVMLSDVDDGITSWWWDAVSSANRLVAWPASVHVSNEERMVNALSLISDIISIGDLVLKYEFDYLQKELGTNEKVRSAITATPGIMCNLIMEKVGLDNWFPIEIDALKESGYEYSRESRKKYGIMFVILAEKSNMFANVSWGRSMQSIDVRQLGIPRPSKSRLQRISGQQILSEFIRPGRFFPNEDDRDYDRTTFEAFAAKLAHEWLFEWGCFANRTLRDPVLGDVSV